MRHATQEARWASRSAWIAAVIGPSMAIAASIRDRWWIVIASLHARAARAARASTAKQVPSGTVALADRPGDLPTAESLCRQQQRRARVGREGGEGVRQVVVPLTSQGGLFRRLDHLLVLQGPQPMDPAAHDGPTARPPDHEVRRNGVQPCTWVVGHGTPSRRGHEPDECLLHELFRDPGVVRQRGEVAVQRPMAGVVERGDIVRVR